MHPRPFHPFRRQPALGRGPFRRHLTGLLVSSFLVGAFAAVPATAAPAAPDELPRRNRG